MGGRGFRALPLGAALPGCPQIRLSLSDQPPPIAESSSNLVPTPGATFMWFLSNLKTPPSPLSLYLWTVSEVTF